MNKTSLRLVPLASAFALALALTACGGGGGGGGYFPIGSAPPATTPPAGGGEPTQPPVVSAYDAFIAYVVALVNTSSETDDPADVAKFDPAPTSETNDPVATP
ncbi:hypothetical protein [Variovorax sp. PAMC 28711]|uniref:hypothetical protein n=1 Tax=Variovorax sp. PAMC 28711 TaxID=1795631 RepID=UPI00078C7586|nr:hypothetical protein [Variovorax sp. PAMC 28711]AMM25403.1 hypothetical protein AX767_14330 [Variovorax sp. PAMC 28711]